MTEVAPAAAPAVTGAPSPAYDKRWFALAVIALAQLMVVLDASIVNIALPSAQTALGISDADRQWVITAYTLTFGGLLLLGGRIADFMGRKRIFMLGLLGFAVASALGGAAQNGPMLFAARALQGAFGALLAPASLSLLTVTFTEAKERARAFGVYGAIAGGGAAVGLILGGVLTQYLSWRWCLLVNVPVALIAVLAAWPLVRESRAHGDTRYDVPGALTATGGLVALVYGFTKAQTDGWMSAVTLSFLAAALVLLVGFVIIETRTRHPLLPLRVVLDRNRGGSYLASLLAGLGLFGMFLFMTFYFQGTLHYGQVKAGMAFLPFSAGIIVSASFASHLLPRVGPRALMVTGFAGATAGMWWLAQIKVNTPYVTHVLPAELVMSIGLGLAFVSLISTALVGVEHHDAGVASALVNTTQQVGGALGTALLNTIAASATLHYLRTHTPSALVRQEALVHGYTTAFLVSASVLAAAAVIAGLLVTARKKDLPAPEEAPTPAA